MPDSSASAGAGDMFLSVKGAQHGKINGEAQDQKHQDEIEVLGWSWGMQGKSSLGGGTSSGKVTVRELRIIKRVDKASTALMSALRINEVINEAVLTLRKQGKSPLEYLIIKMERGRVLAVEVEAGDSTGGSSLVERVSFSFNKITVQYTPQGGDGLPQGPTTYQDEWSSDS